MSVGQLDAMKYIRIIWTDAPDGEAYIWYAELDENRHEIRKVVVFSDGHSEWADRDNETDYAWLSETPLPAFDDIANQVNMRPERISNSDFEAAWRKARFDAYPD